MINFNGADMTIKSQTGIFATKWDAERAQAQEEIYQFERERALEDIARLVKRFALTPSDIRSAIGSDWERSAAAQIKPFEPYFGGR